MSLIEAYAETAGEAYDRQLRNPGPEPEPGFSMTSFLGSGLKGLYTGALEIGASFAEGVAGVEALRQQREEERRAYDESRGRFIPPDERRKQVLKGLDEAGHSVRQKAEASAPDPMTTNTANQVIHGLMRSGGKAVGAVATFGPAVGPAVFGVEEGNTVYQELIGKGVDPSTAKLVGMVSGTMGAAGLRLPLSGNTVAQTIGLVGVGGPGAYMAQESLSRKILEKAGYDDQASLHNPFDPLGLALATVIPGAFGAAHMVGRRPALEKIVEHIESGGQRYGKDGQLLTSPKGAQGEMQVMPGTSRDPGFGVKPAQNNTPEELARVGRDYLGAMVNRYGDSDKALAAYNAGPGAVDKAVKAHGDDWLKSLPRETQEYVHKANALGARHVAEVAAESPENVDAARVSVLDSTVARSLPDTPDAYAQMQRASDIVGESGGRAAEQSIAPVRDVDLPQFREWFADSKVVDAEGAPLVMYHGTRADVAEFDAAAIKSRFPHSEGFYLTTSKEHASIYADSVQNGSEKFNPESKFAKPVAEGANVVPAYVSVKNPKIIETTGLLESVVDGDNGAMVRQAKADGHDGVIVRRVAGDEFDGSIAIAIKPEQIKSAIGNSGKFDPHSASLTDPLRPGEVSPREANNALPASDSIHLAGDEAPKPKAAAKPKAEGDTPSTPQAAADRAFAEQLAKVQEGVPLEKAAVLQRDVIDLRKRETVLQKLLECVEAA